MRTTPLFLIGALSVLSAVALYAENAVILESFEDNIDSASLGGAAPRNNGVVLRVRSKTSSSFKG